MKTSSSAVKAGRHSSDAIDQRTLFIPRLKSHKHKSGQIESGQAFERNGNRVNGLITYDEKRK